MPGSQVKDWAVYHALRKKHMSKAKAAKITNARAGKKKSKKKPVKRKAPKMPMKRKQMGKMMGY